MIDFFLFYYNNSAFVNTSIPVWEKMREYKSCAPLLPLDFYYSRPNNVIQIAAPRNHFAFINKLVFPFDRPPFRKPVPLGDFLYIYFYLYEIITLRTGHSPATNLPVQYCSPFPIPFIVVICLIPAISHSSKYLMMILLPVIAVANVVSFEGRLEDLGDTLVEEMEADMSCKGRMNDGTYRQAIERREGNQDNQAIRNACS